MFTIFEKYGYKNTSWSHKEQLDTDQYETWSIVPGLGQLNADQFLIYDSHFRSGLEYFNSLQCKINPGQTIKENSQEGSNFNLLPPKPIYSLYLSVIFFTILNEFPFCLQII